MVRNRGEDLQNPDYTGAAGRAWNIDFGDSRMDMPLGANAVLAACLIEVPFAHPRWNSYMAAVIHLRPIPGAPPLECLRENATHEFSLSRVRPEFEDIADPADIRTIKAKSPPDIEQELILPSDERVLEVLGLAAQACVGGTLNPNKEYRQQWTDFLLSHE